MRQNLLDGAWIVRLLTPVMVSLFVLVIQSPQNLPGPIKSLDHSIRDFVIQTQASDQPENRIVLIDIDEQSLRSLGPWPWPRSRLADLVNELIEGHAVTIVGLDIVMPDARDIAGDTRLQALAIDRKLVLSQVLDYSQRDTPIRTGSLAGGIPAKSGTAPQAAGFLANHSALANVPCVGNIGFKPDSDGTLRRLALYSLYGEQLYPNLPVAILLCLGKPAPTPENFERTVEFRRTSKAWTVIPAHEILQQSQSLPRLAGSIAIIGSSALGLSDQVAIPLGGRSPGYFVHAQQLSELLDPRLTRPTQASLILNAGSVLLLFALSSSLSLVRRTFTFVTTAVCAALLLTCWLWLESSWQADLSPVTLLIGVVTLVFIQGGYEWGREWLLGAGKLDMLRRYVSPEVLKSLINNQGFDAIKPRHAKISVLVVDIVSYSAHVQALPLEESTKFTKTALDLMTGPVLKHRGTLDRYTGDGLVAFWGAPLNEPKAPALAFRAAQDIRKILLSELGVNVRCGISTGEALVGDVGTAHRSHYTAVGRCINLASRLEALSKPEGVWILIDSDTANELESGSVQSKGSQEIRGIGVLPLYTASEQ